MKDPFADILHLLKDCKYPILEWTGTHPVSGLFTSVSLMAVAITVSEWETAYLPREMWKTFPAIYPKYFTKAWLNGKLVLENNLKENLKFSSWSGSSGGCRKCANQISKDFKGVKVHPSQRSPKKKKNNWWWFFFGIDLHLACFFSARIMCKTTFFGHLKSSSQCILERAMLKSNRKNK